MIAAVVPWTILLVNGSRPQLAAASAQARLPSIDVGFSQSMIQEDVQSATMSHIVLAGARITPQIGQLATAVQAAADQQVGTLQGWLILWDAPPASAGPPMQWMTTADHPAETRTAAGPLSRAGIPGMASQREINELGGSSGQRLGLLYLELMIRHDEGCLSIARYAAAHAAAPQVRELARQTLANQRRQIIALGTLLRTE
jgi:uncharacterized protein (DUF305 family)